MKPRTFEPHPSPVVGILGGLVGTLLATALLFVAPAFGLPFLELLRLLGGVVTADAPGAFAVGAVVFFAVGTLVIPFGLARFWPRLPGSAHGVAAAIVKGLVAGIVLWLVWSLLLPALAALNRFPTLPRPGFFALGHGVTGLVWLLVVQLAYGLALAVIVDMGRGIEPLGTLGWSGYGAATTPAPEGKGL
jgi:hypothetical protein